MNKAQLREKLAEIAVQIDEHKTAREKIITHVPDSLVKRWLFSALENRINDLRDRRKLLNQSIADIESSDIGVLFIDGKRVTTDDDAQTDN